MSTTMPATTVTTADLGNDEPMHLVKRIMDKYGLDTIRKSYQLIRAGQAAKIHVVQPAFTEKVEASLHRETAGPRVVGDSGDAVVERSLQEPRTETERTYDLAKDVRVDPKIDQAPKFEACFGRHTMMRSDILVKSSVIENLSTQALDVIPRRCHRSSIYVVTDTVTDKLYGTAVFNGLLSAGLNVTKCVIPSATDSSGETSTEGAKDLETFSKLADQILKKGVDKRSAIISVGGGVVNNICGFLAGSIYRGITLCHFSTTFMGQVDAAIDFKQAVNHCCGKNLLGCYYPATKIILDPKVLLTQSKRHRLNGLAEALKHGMVHSTDLIKYIVEAGTVDDPDYLDGVVRRTIAVKVPTLTRYEESDFNEMAPQFGHAPAHAIEFLSWHGGCPHHGPLLHGEAVAIGMCVSAEVAYIMGVCTRHVVEEHYRLVASVGLPTCTPDELDVDAIIAKLSYDKHTLSKKPTMGLLKEIGHMFEKDGVYSQPVEPETLRRAFKINIARGVAALQM